jgi:quercetin dioxygenase-like cupin family protein
MSAMNHRHEGRVDSAFTDTHKNHDGLSPTPARSVDAACIHRGVLEERALEFSAERGHPVHPVRLPGVTVSLSIGELTSGASTGNHRHAYESLVYILAGRGHTIMDGTHFDWSAGDAIYTPPWCWHRHVAAADGPVQYLTATNMPLLHAIGQTVMREEESAPPGRAGAPVDPGLPQG